MAASKSKLEKSLRSHNEVRIENLLKLYFYPEDKRDREGWKWSVFSSLRSVPLLRNNKYPDFEFIYEQVWIKPFEGRLTGELDRRVLFLSRSVRGFESPKFPLGIQVVENCYDVCRRYSNWLADKLSSIGSLSWVYAFEYIEFLMQSSMYIK
jgi:hypothetical protein